MDTGYSKLIAKTNKWSKEFDKGRIAAAAAHGFWATICKTVCPVLSDRCPVCLSCLSVTLVYCGQTVGWIKAKLKLEWRYIVLDGDRARPKKGTARSHNFSLCLLWRNGWMDQDAT